MKQKLRLESLEDRTTPAAFTPLAITADGALDSLRANILTANSNEDTSNTFTLEAGTYELTIENSDGQENAAAEGDLDLTAGKTYIFEGAGAGVTVLDGNSLDRVFQVFNGSTVIVRNMTITGGLAQDDGESGVSPGATGALGGGILSNGMLTLENVTLTGNTARGVSPDEVEETRVDAPVTGAEGANGQDAEGGGVWQSGGSLTLTNSVVSQNMAEGSTGNDGGDGGAGSEHANGGAGGRGGAGGWGAGGGIYAQDAAVTLTTTTIQKNAVSGGGGGAGGQGGDISGFRDNSTDLVAGRGGDGGLGGAATGGGVYLANVNLTYANTQISENTLAGGVGGLGGLGGKINGKDIGSAIDGGVGGNGGDGGEVHGAGLYVCADTAASTLSGATIRANIATAGAGGLGGDGGNAKAGGESSIDGGRGGLGGNGGEALGGGVYSLATSLTLTGTSSVAANQVKGGQGGEGGWGGDGTGLTSMHSSASGENGGEGGNGGRAAGGGLYLTAADLTLEAGTVSDNRAFGGGGGRGGDGGDAFGTAIESSINGSEGGSGGNGGNAEGGGIYLSVGNLHVTSSLVDANAAVAGNGGEGGKGGDASAQDASTAEGSEGGDGGNGGSAIGGGIYFYGTTFDLTATTVRSNSGIAGAGGTGGVGGNADAGEGTLAIGVTGGDGGDGGIGQGGGIYSNAKTTILTASTVALNSAEGGKGGAGGNGGNGSNDDEPGIRGGGGNAGAGSWALGGGVLIQSGGFTLSNSTVSSNRAVGGAGQNGGAVGLGEVPTRRSVIEESGSSTGDGGDGGDGRGGGLYLNSGGASNLLNSTIAANLALGGKAGAKGEGGSGTGGEVGVSLGGNVDHVGKGVVKATSTIISDGTATWGPDYHGTVTASASLIENVTDATITAGAKPNLTGVDPRLTVLQFNGGPTATHGLLSDSPARDTGDNPGKLVTDQRGIGFDRQIGDGVDMGAFEGSLAAPPPPSFIAAVGSDFNSSPLVEAYNTTTGERVSSFYAYDLAFPGGVRVAVGDVNGDGTPDIITGAGPGGTAHVKVFDGKDRKELYSFVAYATNFQGGVYVGAADVNGDGRADIITGAGAGGGPHVKVFDAATGGEMRSFYAYGELFGGGVTVAGGDIDADGFAEIITGTGSIGTPHVKAFSGVTGAEIRSFMAFGSGANGGVSVASNDLNNDGYADIIVGAGQGMEPEVKAFSGKDEVELLKFMAFDAEFKGGVRVASYTLSGKRFLTTSAGPGAGPRIRVFDAATLEEVSTFYSQTSNFRSGVFVA